MTISCTPQPSPLVKSRISISLPHSLKFKTHSTPPPPWPALPARLTLFHPPMACLACQPDSFHPLIQAQLPACLVQNLSGFCHHSSLINISAPSFFLSTHSSMVCLSAFATLWSDKEDYFLYPLTMQVLSLPTLWQCNLCRETCCPAGSPNLTYCCCGRQLSLKGRLGLYKYRLPLFKKNNIM